MWKHRELDVAEDRGQTKWKQDAFCARPLWRSMVPSLSSGLAVPALTDKSFEREESSCDAASEDHEYLEPGLLVTLLGLLVTLVGLLVTLVGLLVTLVGLLVTLLHRLHRGRVVQRKTMTTLNQKSGQRVPTARPRLLPPRQQLHPRAVCLGVVGSL